MDKFNGKSTWSQINNSKYADLSCLTYLPRTENKQKSDLNAWPWKPHLCPRCWGSQHWIGQDYWHVLKWKGQNTGQALGKSLPEDLTASPKRGDPLDKWQTKILHTGREGGNFLYLWTKLTEYSMPPKGSVFTLNNGAFIELDMTMGVTNRKLPWYRFI